MRIVTKHGLSVLNRRYQSVLIKCLLAGMVFLPHTANAVMNSVSGRLGSGGSDVSGRSGGDLTVGKSVAWVQGLFNRAKMTGGDKFTSGTTGFAAGVEHNVTDEIKAGFGYAFASTDIKTGRSKTDTDTHTGFVYGEYVPDALSPEPAGG